MTQPPRCPGLAGCKNYMLLFLFSTFMSSIPLETFSNSRATIVNGFKLMKEIKLPHDIINFKEFSYFSKTVQISWNHTSRHSLSLDWHFCHLLSVKYTISMGRENWKVYLYSNYFTFVQIMISDLFSHLRMWRASSPRDTTARLVENLFKIWNKCRNY